MDLEIFVAVLARVCLVLLFLFSALDKIFFWPNAVAQANSGAIPGGPVLIVVAIILESVTPVLIIFGWYDRAAALVLAGFCVVTALVYHPFWTFSDFWSPGPDSKARMHFEAFLKNFTMVGGLLLIVFAGSLANPADVFADPFSSTHIVGPNRGR
jgi:putative oxidoreductase